MEKIKPIKSLEELGEIKKGQFIQLNEGLPKHEEIKAKNKGFEPNKNIS